MHRDEPGDSPEGRPDDEPTAEAEWTIEDFDSFAPFDDRDEEDEAESSQGTLEFGFIADDDPIPAAPQVDEFDAEAVVGPSADSGAGDDESRDGPVRGAVASLAAADDEADERVIEAAGAAEALPDDVFEDTVEASFEGGGAATVAPSEEESAVKVPDFVSFTSEKYVQTTTQEFVDLAEEVARAADIEHVQSAVSAEIRGVESGIVGLEDVVVASGVDPAAIPVAPRSNLALRVFTSLALAVIFFASLVDPLFVGVFVLIILFLSAGEFYAALVRAGYRPLGLFGLLGSLGALAGTWLWGLVAVPVAAVGTLVATLLFFGMAADRKEPMTNTALTVLGAVWVGGMGAFVFEMVQVKNYRWLVVATVVTVASMDVASYFVGRRAGRHRLAPRVSPNKTIEGLIGGMLVAMLVGVAFGLRDPFDLGSGLALGAIVAVGAPFGDLAVSMLKRSIGAKDMGTLLPGHGGLLDRIDAMLFTIPLAWIVFSWTGLLV